MEINWDAMLLAYKFLTIFFIIITISVNAEYLSRYFQAPKAAFRAGHFGKISVTLGSIFLVLFPYVVQAKRLFEDSSDMTCQTIVMATTYQRVFFPFVFGFTIFSTCLNLYLDQRQCLTFNFNPIWVSLAMAAFPWLLALLVMCPLVFVGMEWSHCRQTYSLERDRAIILIGIILPSLVALLFSIVLNVMPSASKRQHLTTTLNSDPTASAVSSNRNVSMSEMDATKLVSQLTQRNALSSWTQYPVENPQSQSQQESPQFSQQQYPQQYLQHDPPPNAQPYLYHPQETRISAGDVCVQTTAPAASAYITLQLVVMEKRGLLHASLIFFFSVLPYACFILGYDLGHALNEKRNVDQSMMMIIRDSCTWVSYLFPVLIPIAWRRQVQ